MSTCKGNYFPTRVFIPSGPSGSWESAHRPPSLTAVTWPGQPPALQSLPPPRSLKFTVQVLLPRSPSKKSPAPGGGLLRAGVLPLWSTVSRAWSLNTGEDPTEFRSVEPFLWDRLSVSLSHRLTLGASSETPEVTSCWHQHAIRDPMLASDRTAARSLPSSSQRRPSLGRSGVCIQGSCRKWGGGEVCGGVPEIPQLSVSPGRDSPTR